MFFSANFLSGLEVCADQKLSAANSRVSWHRWRRAENDFSRRSDMFFPGKTKNHPEKSHESLISKDEWNFELDVVLPNYRII